MYYALCNLIHLQDEITKVKFMLRILEEKNHAGYETGSRSRYGSEPTEKLDPNPDINTKKHCITRHLFCVVRPSDV